MVHNARLVAPSQDDFRLGPIEWPVAWLEGRTGRGLVSVEGLADAICWPICNLDRKNPNRKADFEHLPPEQLADDILQKELRSVEIKDLLARKP